MFEKVYLKKNQLVAKAHCYASQAIDVCQSNDLKISATATGLIAMANSLSVMAGATSKLIGEALGYVCFAFRMVGIFVALYQFIQLVSAIKEENGDRQQKAIIGLVVGAVFIGAGTIANKVITASGINGITVNNNVSL